MKNSSIKHLIPLSILLLLATLVYIFGFSKHLSLETLKTKETLIFSWISLHPFLSALTLASIYIISICLFIPASTALTFVAAIAYPFPYALALSIFSETIGTCLFFIILQLAFSPDSLSKTSIPLGKAEKNFQKNPASYLLFLRFSHLIPSWLISSLAAMFKASFWTFAWTTFLGTIPISYLTVQTANTLKNTHNILNWHDFFDTNTKLLFIAFGIISLTPVFVKKFIKY